MRRVDLVRAFFEGSQMPEHGPLTSQMSALYVDEWWAAAVRLNERCFLVRASDDGPMPDLSDLIVPMLVEAGLQNLGTENDWPLIDGITLQRLGVVGPRWQLWGESSESARQAIEGAVMEIDSTPSQGHPSGGPAAP